MKLLDKYSVQANDAEKAVCLELYSYSKRIKFEHFKPIVEALSINYSFNERQEIENFFKSINEVEEDNVVSFILSFMNKNYGYIYPSIYAIHFELTSETLSFLDGKYNFEKIEKEHKQKIRKLFLDKKTMPVHKLLMNELDWFDHFCYENNCTGYIKNMFSLSSHSMAISHAIKLDLKKKTKENMILNEILNSRLSEKDYKKLKSFLSLSKQDEFKYPEKHFDMNVLIDSEIVFRNQSNESYDIIEKAFSDVESLVLSFLDNSRFRFHVITKDITNLKKSTINYCSLKSLKMTKKEFNILIGIESKADFYTDSVYKRRQMFNSIKPTYGSNSSSYPEIDLSNSFFVSMKSWLREYDPTVLFGAVVLVNSTNYNNSEADQYGVISYFHYDENKKDYMATIYLADLKESAAIIVKRSLTNLLNAKILSKDEALVFYHDMSLLKSEYSIRAVYSNLRR